MKPGILPLLLLISILFGSCDLDNFLFNNEKVDHYLLPGNTIPASLLEQVSFKSDGNTLYGYWVQSNGARPGITVLYCHGNKHSLDEYWDRVMLLHDLGVNVFIFDYRGFGMSRGSSSEAGLYQDAESAFQFISTRYAVREDSLCIYGFSLGNVPSIYLAAEICNPLCLVAESPFASANSMTQGSVLLDIPSLWLTKGEFDNAKTVRQIKTPFLLIHGEQDDFVRYRDNGRVVYVNAPEPKSLLLVPSANHTDIPARLGFDKYRNAIEDWINTSIRAKNLSSM